MIGLLFRSPIYAHFSETLGGLSAIRAFGHVKLFARTNERLVDNNLASYFALKVSDLDTTQSRVQNSGARPGPAVDSVTPPAFIAVVFVLGVI